MVFEMRDIFIIVIGVVAGIALLAAFGSAESIVAYCIAYAMQYQSFIYKEDVFMDIADQDGAVICSGKNMIVSNVFLAGENDSNIDESKN